MAGEQQSQQGQPLSPVKDPSMWKTGDDPATPAQYSTYETTANELGLPVEPIDSFDKAGISREIDRLRMVAGLPTQQQQQVIQQEKTGSTQQAGSSDSGAAGS